MSDVVTFGPFVGATRGKPWPCPECGREMPWMPCGCGQWGGWRCEVCHPIDRRSAAQKIADAIDEQITKAILEAEV